MGNTDVQLSPEGVWVRFDGVQIDLAQPAIGAVEATLTPDEFDLFAEQVAEARRNKAGRSTVTCATASVRIGDFIHGLEVVGVRQFTHGRTEIRTRPFGWMIFDGDLIQTFERSIS